ncbi:MAG: PQQ-dependent sugar dehydrogenase [Aquamicrobium sp.]|uniref:PQQ-dependent sugar dehydrogenase n=1 Tax=Aquamicrobium sp. TaxID=1872579 RepID=UPI00349E7B8B|nr:PQQ-dependent sugar dehydrogenase [Aquamicrobium sp.]
MFRSASLLGATLPMLLLGTACAQPVDGDLSSEAGTIRVETVVGDLSHPWAIAVLPDGGMLVTEREGRLRHVSAGGALSAPLSGVPAVETAGQGGLLDVALDPDFAANRLVYLSFSEGGDGGNSTAVARGRLSDDLSGLDAVEVIFSQSPKVDSSGHFGSRLVFGRDGNLFVTLGDRQSGAFRGEAQNLGSHIGKIVRIRPDGSVPDDNPFVGRAGALPEIWAWGIRNSQAAALHPETGLLWEIEHGPRGGDELNVIRPGENYGWPLVTLGVEYSGLTIGDGLKTAPDMVDAIYSWTPVIAPSGMLFYSGEAFPDWQGDLFVGGLASTALVRLELDGERVVHEERLLEPLKQRIRDVAEGPDGALYVATDEAEGRILRIVPAR